jgi:cellulose synthase/poly-beta-1,6-N-acetylglucosamine synthase-like glycosyltransferase
MRPDDDYTPFDTPRAPLGRAPAQYSGELPPADHLPVGGQAVLKGGRRPTVSARSPYETNFDLAPAMSTSAMPGTIQPSPSELSRADRGRARRAMFPADADAQAAAILRPRGNSTASSSHSSSTRGRPLSDRALSKGKSSSNAAPKRSPNEMTSAERDLRLLSSKAAEAYAPTRLDRILMRFGMIKLYFFVIMALSFAAPIGVLVAEEMTHNFALYGRYVWRVATFLTLSMTIPMWIAMMQWRPAYPMNGKPAPGEDVPTVDIAICTYKEDIGEIVDTIIACQRVEYAENMLHIYVLDDGHRAEMKEVCRQLHRSDLLRHPLTYVDRPTNEGKKAGNINHWLREFEHESGEFFIILDADMQPFPDILDILMGHYFGLSPLEQEITAFIQSPQFYRNYNNKAAWSDLYNISEFFFYRVLQPAMSHHGCSVYVGCCALWSRRAIESVGGFIGGYATEDSVTGCQVNRTLCPGTDYRWLSKFVQQPVAAGVSPDNLPALLEQRMRWYVGLCEMFAHHNGYIFATGLRPMQRILYWVCSASYIANIVNYLTVYSGTMILLFSIAFYGYKGTLGDLSQWAFWAGPGALAATLAIWSFIPGCTFTQFAHTMSTVFLYTPVYVAAILKHYFGIKIKVQQTAAEESTSIRRWHPFFALPIFVVVSNIIMAAVALAFTFSTKGKVPVAPVVQVPIWLVFWFYVHYHVLAAMSGFAYKEIKFYGEEAVGEYSDENVKAHLARHRAILTTGSDDASDDEMYDSSGEDEAMSSSAITGSSDSSREGDKLNPLTSQERREIAATLSFHLARRRAIAETIVLDQYANGDLEVGDVAGAVSTHDEPSTDPSKPHFERRFLAQALQRSAGASRSQQPYYANGSSEQF